MALSLSGGAGGAMRGSWRVTARDDLLGTPRQGVGAAAGRPVGGVSGRRPGSREVRAGPSRLARSPRRQPWRHGRDGHRRCARSGAGAVTGETLVTLSEIAEIELFILKRMKEFTLGDHASVFKGGGFNFVGVRDWQPGDRMSSIDWAQSSMTNFSPLVTRDFEQDSTATIVAGVEGVLWSPAPGAAGSIYAPLPPGRAP